MADSLNHGRMKLSTVMLAFLLCVPVVARALFIGIPFTTPWDHSRPIGHNDMTIDVAPTDDAILFNAVGNGRRDLYLLQLSDGSVKRITDTPEYEVTPAFSNDGALIAYAAGVPGDRADHLFTIKADGSGRTQLTRADANDTAPAWSPDNKMIVFARDKTYNWGGLAASWTDSGVICIVNADGTGERQLTPDEQEASSPHFSADGQAVLYSTASGLYSIPIDGTGEATRVGLVKRPVAMTVTGEEIVFSDGKYSPDFQIFMARINGLKKRRLTRGGSGWFHPVFNKKGDRVFCLAEHWPDGPTGDLKFSIWSVMLDGSEQIEIADYSLFDEPLTWDARRMK